MNERPGLDRDEVQKVVDDYHQLHDDDRTSSEERVRAYTKVANHYYDLVTDFYEYGWGQSFHFAPRASSESFAASLARHQHRLADALQLKPGGELLDIGCGVGGPMRSIAKHTGCRVLGVNNNAYQIERGRRHSAKASMSDVTSFLKADFMDLPLEDDRFDGAYVIEASCHAPSRTDLFRGVRRVMKPGALFAGYTWCLTDGYRADDPEHVRIRKDIEIGNGLPAMSMTHEVDDALRDAGFEIVQVVDLAAEDSHRTWYDSLRGDMSSLRGFPRTPLGRSVTRTMTSALEKLRIAPKGTTEVSALLNRAADALVEGGERQMFTPMYFFVARA